MTITLLKDKILLLEEELREFKSYMQEKNRRSISIYKQEEILLEQELQELKNELHKNEKSSSSNDNNIVDLSCYSK